MQYDLKPQELYQYEGMTPCPQDFDDYWERGLKETEAVKPQAQLRPALPWVKNMEAFDLYFIGIGDARIHARYMRPEGAKKAPVIFLFHGYSGKALDWTTCMTYVSQGFCVASLDCRGQGGESQEPGTTEGNPFGGWLVRGLDEDSPDKLLFRKIFLDIVQLVRVVEQFEEIDRDRMYATGCSQGGGLTLACAALCPQIKKAAAECPFLTDYKRGWEHATCGPYKEIDRFFQCFDPQHEREDEIFYKLGYIDAHNLAGRIKAKVLMFTGLLDRTCPPSTQFAAYNKIQTEKKVFFYPDYDHCSLPDAPEKILEWFLEED